ncbi:protein of unknown function [Andreprevotia lacus DSM 23236]|jgi:hypothetical protein|uniref:TMEM205-like domain-containing protein n=1 Tax=Andreprevotia lacus DSM 23236 TaxID=1121001 RepID=A0A1W1WZB9_9NEIS|nr:DUF4149 domain-containing protein [Andreprevotia lacus]SMC17072.1 protein of unknown function [Andreprevotia lacus DSM 23236]
MGVALKNILTALWIGGMWIIGVLVAPILFKSLNDGSALAITSRLFHAIGWVGIVAGAYLFFYWLYVDGLRAFQGARLWLVIGMLACTLINQFAVFPIIAEIKPGISEAATGVFGGGLSNWRAISTLIYLLQAVMGLFYVARGDGK